MQHSVYLQGDLGEKFGSKFIVNTDNYADVFKCINANRPEFLPYLRKCHDEDIGFVIETAGEEIGEEDLLVPLRKGDITIAIAPAGSKSGVGKIIAAAFLVFFVLPMIGGAAALTAAQASTITATSSLGVAMQAGMMTLAGKATALLAVNLALSGIQQMMAPDPAVDQDSPTDYLFTGQANTQTEGDPIPLLYGELRVPGRPIAIDIIQGGVPITNNVVLGSDGSGNSVGSEEVAATATTKVP